MKGLSPIPRTNVLVVLGVFIISTFAASTLAAAIGNQVGPSAAQSFTLHGSTTAGWGLTSTTITTPGPTLTVAQGDVIAFALFAQDSQAHTLVIDVDRDGTKDTGEPESTSFSSPTNGAIFTYTANTAGTIQYYCGLHGAGVMRGTLVVQGDNTILIVGGIVVVVAVIAAAAGIMVRRRKAKPPTQP